MRTSLATSSSTSSLLVVDENRIREDWAEREGPTNLERETVHCDLGQVGVFLAVGRIRVAQRLNATFPSPTRGDPPGPMARAETSTPTFSMSVRPGYA